VSTSPTVGRLFLAVSEIQPFASKMGSRGSCLNLHSICIPLHHKGTR
jgi:hypothetical protein